MASSLIQKAKFLNIRGNGGLLIPNPGRNQHYNFLLGPSEGHIEQAAFRFQLPLRFGVYARPDAFDSVEQNHRVKFFPLAPRCGHQVHGTFPQLRRHTSRVVIEGRNKNKLLFSQFYIINEPAVVVAVAGSVLGQLYERGVSEKYGILSFAKMPLQALKLLAKS